MKEKAFFASFLKDLHDQDTFKRMEAAKMLGEMSTLAALEALMDAMGDDESPGAPDGGRVAEQLQRVDRRRRAGQGAEGRNWVVRGASAAALGKIGDPKAFEPLLNVMHDTGAPVREHAALALGELGDMRAVEALSVALHDEDGEVRKNTKIAMSKMARHVVVALKDDDPAMREIAAEQLGKIGDPYAVPFLIEALKDDESVVRENACLALGRIGDKSVIQPLIKALKDKQGYVRKNAANALGMLKDPSTVEALVVATRDKQWFVRKDAAGRWARSAATGRSRRSWP